MIDWLKIAEQNGMSFEEFTNEILLAAIAAGAVELENRDVEALRVTGGDGDGKIQMVISRVD